MMVSSLKRIISHEPDYKLIAGVFFLLLFGLMMLTSASSVVGYDRFGDAYFFIKRQLTFGVIPGLVALLFLAKMPFGWLKPLGMGIVGMSFVLLILVFIPGIGSTLNTAAYSWIVIGGYSFQPAELAKLGLIFFFAYQLSARGSQLQSLQEGFLPALLMGLIPIGLVVLQPDIGTASILFAIVFGMLLIAEAKPAHLGGLLTVAVVIFFILIAVAPYRAARFTTFLHPELDPQGQGYHINQAYLAIGSGGLLGHGLGGSRQKFEYLPEVHADSIFAIIAEEMGFIMSVGLLILLICIAYRMLRIAQYAPDQFSRYIVGGILIWFMVQALSNIAAMVGLMPLTGVPLPFISHGGTALAINLAAVGIVLNISKVSTV